MRLRNVYQVGHVLGAHGVKGEVKVRSSTDFAIKRLCSPGVKHIKAPNRRFPREFELLGGRLQKEDIFLLQLEVSQTLCPLSWSGTWLVENINTVPPSGTVLRVHISTWYMITRGIKVIGCFCDPVNNLPGLGWGLLTPSMLQILC